MGREAAVESAPVTQVNLEAGVELAPVTQVGLEGTNRRRQ